MEEDLETAGMGFLRGLGRGRKGFRGCSIKRRSRQAVFLSTMLESIVGGDPGVCCLSISHHRCPVLPPQMREIKNERDTCESDGIAAAKEEYADWQGNRGILAPENGVSRVFWGGIGSRGNI